MSLTASDADEPRMLHRALVDLMRQAFGVQCYAEISTAGLSEGEFRLVRVWREDEKESTDDPGPWDALSLPIRRGGAMAELIAHGQACAINRLQISPADPVYEELGMYRSVAGVPGSMGDAHSWVLIFKSEFDSFTPEDVEALIFRVNLIAIALRNLQTLAHVRRLSGELDQEVDRIAAIQRSLLPPDSPEVPGLTVAARFETFDRAGGDLYDYAKLADDRWVFLIADASGHGPSAAVVSAMLNAILHAVPTLQQRRQLSPADIFRCGNAQMVTRCIEQSFITAFLGIWDPANRSLTYSRAGHVVPMVRRGKLLIPLDAVGDLPLGLFLESSYSESVIHLQRGDIVVMYTDGITEAFSAEHEMFSDDQLRQAILAAEPTAQAVLDRVWAAVTAHQSGATPRDDQTLLVLQVQ